MSSPGFIQAPVDSTGKRIGNIALTLPSGTIVTNADGTFTTLTVDTPVFVQRVVLSDPDDQRAIAAIGDMDPLFDEYGLTTRDVAGSVTVKVLKKMLETLQRIEKKI